MFAFVSIFIFLLTVCSSIGMRNVDHLFQRMHRKKFLVYINAYLIDNSIFCRTVNRIIFLFLRLDFTKDMVNNTCYFVHFN